jgi:acetyl-CoA C-acetyltransferase
MNKTQQTVIVSAVRTPMGSFNGVFSGVSATKLGSIAIVEALKRAHVRPDQVDAVYMGCVLSAGLGQAPARQASIGAGIPHSVGATTVNKVCGSSLKTVIMASQAIALGKAKIVVAGGMENMTRAPYLLEKARQGYRLGHTELVDSVIKDGLWDVYNNFHMGDGGELCAAKYRLTRREVDDFALESYRRAQSAIANGVFKREIVPVDVPQRKGSPLTIMEDEEPNRVDLKKMCELKPVFKADGLLTVGNSPSCNDGAAALVVMAEDEAARLGLAPMARIIDSAGAALAPEWFTIAPIEAIKLVLKQTGLSISDIDLFEINEAFSAVSVAINRELGLNPKKVNVNGGAVALGHPIGATGARILTTLLYALEANGTRRGLASLCIGGGEAIAIVVERMLKEAKHGGRTVSVQQQNPTATDATRKGSRKPLEQSGDELERRPLMGTETKTNRFEMMEMAKVWKEGYLQGLETSLQLQEQNEQLVKQAVRQGLSAYQQWLAMVPFFAIFQTSQDMAEPLLETACETSFEYYETAVAGPARKYTFEANKKVLDTLIPN